MRKSWVLPGVVLALGALGAFFRKLELERAFEPNTGFAIKYAPETIAVAVVGLVAFIFALAFAIRTMSAYKPSIGYAKTFKISNFASLALSAVCGIVLIGAALWLCVKAPETLMSLGSKWAYLFALLTVISGVAMIILAVSAFTGKYVGSTAFFSVVPTLLCCLWFITEYKIYASCPIVNRYCYKCLALTTLALAFYYAAGYAFGRVKPKMTLITHFMAVYFLCVTLADTWSVQEMLMLVAMLVYTFINAVRFLKALNIKTED